MELDAGEAEFVEMVGDLDRSGAYLDDGSVSPAAWLRRNCRMNQSAAQRVVHLARQLAALPATADAFGTGEISVAHAHVIADAATEQRADVIAEIEPQLVDIARAVTPRETRAVVRRVCDALDGDGGAGESARQYDRRYLYMSETFEGMFRLDGLLDPETGKAVRRVFKRAMELDKDADERRTTGQRRADALLDICRASKPCLESGPGRSPVNGIVVVDYPEIEKRARVRLDARAHDGDGSPIPVETIRRMLCDASIARVVTNGPSEVLDVGRSTRTIPTALWNALVVRDGGCTEDGCDRPPGWCDVHHIVHWSDGGETNLENTKLKCRRHHRAEHERGDGRGHDPPR